MVKPNINISKLKALISDPILSEDTFFLYFTADRDPTASEPVIDEIGIPAYWPFWWWNTTTNQWFLNQVPTASAMVWINWVFDFNILSVLAAQGWKTNTARNYTASGISLNTARQPSLTNDVEVNATIKQINPLLTSTAVTFEVSPDSSTWTTVGSIGVDSGAIASYTAMSRFKCPAGYYYRMVSSGAGTVTLTSCNELLC